MIYSGYQLKKKEYNTIEVNMLLMPCKRITIQNLNLVICYNSYQYFTNLGFVKGCPFAVSSAHAFRSFVSTKNKIQWAALTIQSLEITDPKNGIVVLTLFHLGGEWSLGHPLTFFRDNS